MYKPVAMHRTSPGITRRVYPEVVEHLRQELNHGPAFSACAADPRGVVPVNADPWERDCPGRGTEEEIATALRIADSVLAELAAVLSACTPPRALAGVFAWEATAEHMVAMFELAPGQAVAMSGTWCEAACDPALVLVEADSGTALAYVVLQPWRLLRGLHEAHFPPCETVEVRIADRRRGSRRSRDVNVQVQERHLWLQPAAHGSTSAIRELEGPGLDLLHRFSVPLDGATSEPHPQFSSGSRVFVSSIQRFQLWPWQRHTGGRARVTTHARAGRLQRAVGIGQDRQSLSAFVSVDLRLVPATTDPPRTARGDPVPTEEQPLDGTTLAPAHGDRVDVWAIYRATNGNVHKDRPPHVKVLHRLSGPRLELPRGEHVLWCDLQPEPEDARLMQTVSWLVDLGGVEDGAASPWRLILLTGDASGTVREYVYPLALAIERGTALSGLSEAMASESACPRDARPWTMVTPAECAPVTAWSSARAEVWLREYGVCTVDLIGLQDRLGKREGRRAAPALDPQ